MNSKRVGVVLIVISLVLGAFVWYTVDQLNKKSNDAGCFANKDCAPIQNSLSLSHALVGVISFLVSLGFYMVFLNKSDDSVFRRLEEEKQRRVEEEKYSILMKALDPHEQKVISAVRDQDGITQNTLRIRTDMSKAKLSYVLQELERRGLVKRIEKGKTLAVHLKESF